MYQAKSSLSQALDKAAMVLLQPGSSRHMMWEIDQALSRCSWGKLLFWLTGLERRQALYDPLRIYLERRTRLRLPRALGRDHFLILEKTGGRMLQMLESNPFAWPVLGTSVSFPRTLAPFLRRVIPMPPVELEKSRGLSRFVRPVSLFAAFLFWQAATPLLLIIAMLGTELFLAQCGAHQLRQAMATPPQQWETCSPAPRLGVQWLAPAGWQESEAYSVLDHDEKGARNFQCKGWAWGSQAFIFFHESPTTPPLATLYERDPVAACKEHLKEVAKNSGLKLGRGTVTHHDGRPWGQAEFSTRKMNVTWADNLSLLDPFGPKTRGILRVTYGPEGVLEVFAFSPGVLFPGLKKTLLTTLDNVQFLNLGDRTQGVSKRSSGGGYAAFEPLISGAPATTPAAQQVHALTSLPEKVLALSGDWQSQDGQQFRYGKEVNVDLRWDFRPREISDSTVRAATERSLRRYEAAQATRFQPGDYQELDATRATLTAQSRQRWLIQQTSATESGVITLTARCPLADRARWEATLRQAVTGLYDEAKVDREKQALSQVIQAAPQTQAQRQITGKQTRYTLRAPAYWQDGDPGKADTLLVCPAPCDAVFLITFEPLDGEARMLIKNAQPSANSLADDVSKEEGVASCQLRESALLSAHADGDLTLHVRLAVQFADGTKTQRTYQVHYRGAECLTLICFSSFASPATHDALFSPLLGTFVWDRQ